MQTLLDLTSKPSMTMETNSLAVAKVWSIGLAKDVFPWESNHRQ